MAANEETGTRKVVLNGKVFGEIELSGDLRRDAEAARDVLRRAGVYRPPTELEAMHRQAYAFANTAAHIHDEMLQKGQSEAAVPFVVNSCFAIEVYLKTLIKSFGGNAKLGKGKTGHELKALLDALPEAAQMAIKWEIPRTLSTQGLAERYDLSAILDQLNTAFVDYRYHYEADRSPKGVHIPHVIYTLQLLHAASHRAVIGDAGSC